MAEIVNLNIEELYPHPDNPRKDLGDLSELVTSIRANGILQNLTVVPNYDPGGHRIHMGTYTVLIGHRRLAAAKEAGLTTLPCVVTEMSEAEQIATMLTENMQRTDLTPYEQAQGFQMMLDLGGNIQEITKRTGFSETTVRRRLKMAELDPVRLREVSDRQLSLGDFDLLAQIEDINERNSVLESIGTKDFNRNVAAAMSKQKQKQNLPLVKAWLKEAGAKKITKQESWGNAYEHYPNVSYVIYIDRWGEDDNKLPRNATEQIYYTLEDNWMYLYRKRQKAAPVEKTVEEREKEHKLRDAWAALDEVAAMLCRLRKTFIEGLTVTEKNREKLLRGALFAAILEAVTYSSPDRETVLQFFNIDTQHYDSARAEKLNKGIDGLKDQQLPALIYALFGDDAKMACLETTYRGSYPRYQRDAKLSILYDWLISLGYEMSTEETQFLDGSHSVYSHGLADEENTRR